MDEQIQSCDTHLDTVEAGQVRGRGWVWGQVRRMALTGPKEPAGGLEVFEQEAWLKEDMGLQAELQVQAGPEVEVGLQVELQVGLQVQVELQVEAGPEVGLQVEAGLPVEAGLQAGLEVQVQVQAGVKVHLLVQLVEARVQGCRFQEEAGLGLV